MKDTSRTALAALWLLTIIWASHAAASLQVFPTRVTLSDQQRVANISVRHIGNKATKYKISAVFYRMKADGSMELAENPVEAERPATKMLRFSPRATTLPPNVEQVVRVMYAGPKKLPDGEYRAHLHFEPTDDPGDDAPTTTINQGKVSMQLRAKVAVAVPVIYKQGTATFTPALSNLKLTKMADQKPGFSVDLETTGNAFPFGDFMITFTAKGGSPQQVGLVKSVASYLAKRTVNYGLNVSSGTTLSGGTLRVEYRQPEDAGGKVLAFVETAVP